VTDAQNNEVKDYDDAITYDPLRMRIIKITKPNLT
jgi:hypothetical protein